MRLRGLLPAIGALAAAAYARDQPASPGSERPAQPFTAAPAFNPWNEAGGDVVSFEPFGRLMTVAVNVMGQGPYPFLVDSGAERTVISRELVDRLALGPGRSVRVHTMADAQTVPTALIPHLQFSTRSVRDIHAPAFPAALIRAAGILGIDSLQRQRVVFDFKARTMTITPSRSVRVRPEPEAIVITARNVFGRLVLTNASVAGQRVLAIIDTGTELTIGNGALRDRLARRGRLSGKGQIEMTSVTGQSLVADYRQVDRITLGGLMITDMPMAFVDGHLFRQLGLGERPAILLGMDALRLFTRVSVDFARKEIHLLPPGAPRS